MEIKLTTATVVIGTKEVPLSARIVKQLPYFESARYSRIDVEEGNLKTIGTVALTDSIEVLIQAPDGVFTMSQSNFWNMGLKDRIKGSLERIVLL